MKFVADECCAKSLIESLRENGHDVLSIAESKPGIKDENVLKESYEENRILLTEDKDFGEIVFRLKKPARGIILLRFDVKERHLKWPILKKLINDYPDRLYGHFVVVDQKRFRFRPLIFLL